MQSLVLLQSIRWSLKHDFALRIWSSAHLWIHPTSVEIDWKCSKHAAHENYSASHTVIHFLTKKGGKDNMNFQSFSNLKKKNQNGSKITLQKKEVSSETLQNLLYFMYKETHVVFFCFSFCATLHFYLMKVDIDQGIYKVKM